MKANLHWLLLPFKLCIMHKIHPTDQNKKDLAKTSNEDEERVFTIWKKSSMSFQGSDGFSVYDNSGRLAFRVDNYSRRCKYFTREIVLMDGDGNPLLSLRPQIMSMHDQWNGYKFEKSNKQLSSKLFSIRKCSIHQTKDHAQVQLKQALIINKSESIPNFTIQGCFIKRSCKIWGQNGEEVARISKKVTGKNSVLLGDDVFSILIQAGFDCALIMAFVVLMDRIFRSR